MQDVKQSSASNPLAQAICQHMKTHDLTAQEMAKEFGISHLYLLAILRGVRPMASVSANHYRNIAGVLGISCVSAMVMGGHLIRHDFGIDERLLAESASPQQLAL